MKAPRQVVLGFDPRKIDRPVFKNQISTILWTCLKTTHRIGDEIMGQFELDVSFITARIEMNPPENYAGFKAIIKTSNLRHFGFNEVGIDKTKRNVFSDEFWKRIWLYITNKKKLHISINLPQPLKED